MLFDLTDEISWIEKPAMIVAKDSNGDEFVLPPFLSFSVSVARQGEGFSLRIPQDGKRKSTKVYAKSTHSDACGNPSMFFAYKHAIAEICATEHYVAAASEHKRYVKPGVTKKSSQIYKENNLPYLRGVSFSNYAEKNRYIVSIFDGHKVRYGFSMKMPVLEIIRKIVSERSDAWRARRAIPEIYL